MVPTTRKNMAQYPPITLLDSPLESDAKSDLVPWADDSSNKGIDYVPTEPRIEIPELGDSEKDEVQILESPLIPLVDLVSDDEKDSGEVEALEPPPAFVVILVSKNEEEVVPLMTLSLGGRKDYGY
jgi:hypothetical protein